VNFTSPNPVTNADFTQVLGDVLKRPALLHVPAFALKLMLGQMAEEALLSSARVQPAVLERTNFRWKYPTLQAALHNLLQS
jgi:NAD dependent epimerase/dehydratase family enzyme